MGWYRVETCMVFGSNKHYKSNYWWVISCSKFICSFVLSAYIGLQACLLFCLLKTKIILFWPFSLEFYTALLSYNCFYCFTLSNIDKELYSLLWSHKGTVMNTTYWDKWWEPYNSRKFRLKGCFLQHFQSYFTSQVSVRMVFKKRTATEE